MRTSEVMCLESVLCVQECAVWKKSNRMDQRETTTNRFIVFADRVCMLV